MSDARLRLARSVLPALALLVAACHQELFRDSETPQTAAPARLREMGTFDPLKEASGPPRTLAEASKDLTADRLPSQKPPPLLDMTLAQARASALQRNLDLRVQLFAPAQAKAAIGVEMAKFEASIVAKSTIDVNADDARKNMKLIDALEELDDVQRVTANFELSSELFAELTR